MEGQQEIPFENTDTWFDKYHRKNPHVYREFERLALKMAATGRKYYSARTIIHVMRWNTNLKEKDSEWKVTNNISPFLARKFMREHPELKDFFATRKSKLDKKD